MGNGCLGKESVAIAAPTLPTFKVVVVGESGCGKTSVVRRFAEEKFESEHVKTTDVDITSVVKNLNVPNRAIVSVELWDIPNKNDVDLRKTYYLDVDAVIVVADISNESSLNLAGSWIVDVANHARVSRTFTESVPNPDGKTFSNKIRKEYARPKPGSIPVVLLGNKFDIAKENYLKQLEADAETEKAALSNGDITPILEEETKETTDEPEQNAGDDDNKDNPLKEPKGSEEDGERDNQVKESEKESGENGQLENEKSEADDDAELSEGKEEVSVEQDASKSGKEAEAQDEASPTDADHTSSGETADNRPGETEGSPNVGTEALAQTEDQRPTDNSTEENSGDHIGNGDVTKPMNGSAKAPSDNSSTKYKKIFPKEEKNGSVVNGLNGDAAIIAGSPTLDETKSTIYAASVASVLPPCVEEIEQIAEKYGYIAGTPVSAKTQNGGIQEAFHSLLRRLAAKKLFNLDSQEAIAERKKKAFDVASTMSIKSGRSKASRSKRIRENIGFEPLQEVGIIEIDEVIRSCNQALQEAEELTGGYAEALHGFKTECYANGFTSNARVSLEMCITAFKRALSSNSSGAASDDPRENLRLMLMTPEQQASHLQPKLNLIVKDKDGFPDMRIVDRDNEDIEEEGKGVRRDVGVPEKVAIVLVEYREKFLLKCIAVTKHAAEVEAILAKRTMELTAKEEKAWETAVSAGLSHEEVRRILATLAQDKARLRGTIEHLRETKKAVQTSAGKIKATLLF